MVPFLPPEQLDLSRLEFRIGDDLPETLGSSLRSGIGNNDDDDATSREVETEKWISLGGGAAFDVTPGSLERPCRLAGALCKAHGDCCHGFNCGMADHADTPRCMECGGEDQPVCQAHECLDKCSSSRTPCNLVSVDGICK